MPTDVFNSSVELMGYDELLSYASEQTGLPTATVIGRVNGELRSNYYSPTLTYDESHSQALANWLGKEGFEVNYNGDGKWSGSVFQTTAQVATPSIVDSNNVVVSRGRIRQWYGNTKEWDGNNAFMKASKFPASGGLGNKALYVANSVGGAITAAATGISLGKVISPLLYDVAPGFWDSVGVSEGSFDPANWASLTNGSDSPFAGLFNLIYGIDPETGKSQAYIDENAYAYMAYAMAQYGIFNTESGQIVDPTYSNAPITSDPVTILYGDVTCSFHSDYYRRTSEYTTASSAQVGVAAHGTSYICYVLASEVPFTGNQIVTQRYDSGGTSTSTSALNVITGNLNGKTFYYAYNFISEGGATNGYSYPDNLISGLVEQYQARYIAYNMLFDSEGSGGIEGISNDPDATQPDISDWTDIPSTLQSLKNQYPDLWNDGMTWNNDDPTDNTYGNTATYIPIPMPSFNYNNSQQPVSSTSTQTNPQLDARTSDATLLKAITEAIQATQTQTQPNMQVPPQNPVTTGTGEPPALVPPSGSASALWSVYHPTQAQVNSFGAWLWTDNIITQIQQLLQNPMEGIITLHKVFAQPVDSGQGTIVVGRLDSNVPSATVNQQYVTVDCGEIDCLEQFGNVFDYSPFTSISIYLPFIGIAPLSVDDVMRSTIHVTYGVDVFTGVCLAMVEVSRDNSTVNMYQYAGVASVEYPLTGTVHNGLITGIMGIVGGFATIATAGAAAPAAIGGVAAAGAGALATGRQAQSRSGNFSGNAGAMGIKTPYLIIERPQTKVADTFPELAGYPTNKSLVLRECSGHIVVKHVHVEGINATQGELIEIENLLESGVLV